MSHEACTDSAVLRIRLGPLPTAFLFARLKPKGLAPQIAGQFCGKETLSARRSSVLSESRPKASLTERKRNLLRQIQRLLLMRLFFLRKGARQSPFLYRKKRSIIPKENRLIRLKANSTTASWAIAACFYLSSCPYVLISLS
jgi:hypothetical protein